MRASATASRVSSVTSPLSVADATSACAAASAAPSSRARNAKRSPPAIDDKVQSRLIGPPFEWHCLLLSSHDQKPPRGAPRTHRHRVLYRPERLDAATRRPVRPPGCPATLPRWPPTMAPRTPQG